uniref:Ubiquitin-like domain-containing protein n=1 Tax=Oryzias melastigma TaxID=30732 RepID=A0A3B3DKQ2_ORYME
MYVVTVIDTDGMSMEIDLCESHEEMEKMTVLQLKEKIARQGNSERPDLRLIFKDEVLHEDSKLLSEYGIQHKSVIHMTKASPEGGTYMTQRHAAGIIIVYTTHFPRVTYSVRLL